MPKFPTFPDSPKLSIDARTYRCRFCDKPLIQRLDLGAQPNANSLLAAADEPESIFSLVLYECSNCTLLQIPDYGVNTFDDAYPFETAISQGYLLQCAHWVDTWVVPRFAKSSRILEIGANDGSLLKILRERGYEPDGIEPVPRLAKKAGCWQSHFETLHPNEHELRPYDLIIANNVIAHTPRLKDFVRNLKRFLNPHGEISMEVPFFKCEEWDTVYHEHYNYFSLQSLSQILQSEGLGVYDETPIGSHGNSFRICAQHGTNPIPITSRFVFDSSSFYSEKIDAFSMYEDFPSIAAYGAAAKGNTFLNSIGLRRDLISFVVDDTPFKQGKFLPGSRIPIVGIETLWEKRPEHIIILPWNHYKEIKNKILSLKPSDYNPCIGAKIRE